MSCKLKKIIYFACISILLICLCNATSHFVTPANAKNEATFSQAEKYQRENRIGINSVEQSRKLDMGKGTVPDVVVEESLVKLKSVSQLESRSPLAVLEGVKLG